MYSQVERLEREQLRLLQDERLRNTISYLSEKIPFYRKRFDQLDLQPEDIHSVEDLPKLPFTRKQDLQDHYPFGLLAVPREQTIRVHASSGTTGKATIVCYTPRDIALFSEVMARSFVAAGVRPGMLLHNAFGYGLFTGGLGIHYGGETLGLTVVPVSGGMTQRQIKLIMDLKPEVLCCTPSYAQTLGEEFRKRGIGPEEISLKYGLFGAEPWTERIRADIDASLGLRATNLYPTQIEEILLSLAGVAPHYQLVVTRTGTLDDLELRAEVSERVVQSLTQNEPIGEETAHDPAMRELQAAIQRAIKGSLGLTLRVSLAMPGTIPRSEGGKLKRTVDLREL